MPGRIKYQDVKDRIEVAILEGEYPVGEKMPPEPDLAKDFHVSRSTLARSSTAVGDGRRDLPAIRLWHDRHPRTESERVSCP